MTSRITDSLFERIASPVDDDVVKFFGELLAEKGDMSAREFRHAVRTEIYRSWPAEDESQGGPGTGDGNRYARQIAYMFQVLNVGVGIVPNVVVPAGEPRRQSDVTEGPETSEASFEVEDDGQGREESPICQNKNRDYGSAFARFKVVIGDEKTREGSENLYTNIYNVIRGGVKANVAACRQAATTGSPLIIKPSYNGFLPQIDKLGGGDVGNITAGPGECIEDGTLLGEGGFGVVFSRGKVVNDGEVTCIATKFFVQDYEGERDDRIRSAHLDEKVINRKIGRFLTDHTLLLTDQRLARLKPSDKQLEHIAKRNEDAAKASGICATIIHPSFYIHYRTFPGIKSVDYFINEPNFAFNQNDITRFISTLKEVAIKCRDNNFVHSDINPDNVMFDRSTRKFYVIDFDSEHTRPCYGIIMPECHDEQHNGRWVYPGYILTAIQKIYINKYNRFIGVKKENYGSKVFTCWDQEEMVGDYSHCIMAILLTACEMVPVDNPDRKAIQMRLWYDNVEAAEGGGLQWKTDHGVLEYYGPNRHPNYRRLGTSAPRIPLTPEEAQALAKQRLKERKERQEKRGGNAPRPPSDTIWSALLGIGVCLLVTAASSIAGSFA
jgi:serine/threonine protein kinase